VGKHQDALSLIGERAGGGGGAARRRGRWSGGRRRRAPPSKARFRFTESPRDGIMGGIVNAGTEPPFLRESTSERKFAMPRTHLLPALFLSLFGLAGALAAPRPAHAQPRESQWRTAPAARSTLGLPANVERLDSLSGITEYRLRSNGMHILLAPNHAAPVITFLVVYHVGSRNEAPGNTGSAHLLEHMIFNKSTKNFGKANGKPTFQEVLAEAGADFGSTNMTTWYDRMTGYSTLPAIKLELAMRIEADRLGRALILDSERQPEMSVVRNEYEIGENNPSVALYKAVVAEAIQAHPYHWSTIGYRSDIEGVSTDKLREHYRDFFHPDNATAVLVGDFDPARALSLFDREFGAFAHSKKPIPEVITVEPPQEGERRVVVKRSGQVGLVEVAYVRPGSLDPDFIPLDVLQAILGFGVNSRLYQALVEKKLATNVDASNYTLMDPFPFLVEATLAPGVGHQKVEDALKAALYEVAKNGVTQKELERAQNQIEVAVIRSRDGTYPFASSLGEAVASASWKWFVGYVDALKKVSLEDVKRVAAKYFVPDHATVGWFIPVTEEASKPAGGALPPTKHGAGGSRWGSGEAAAGAAAAPASAAGGAPVTGALPFAQRTLHRVLSNGITLDVLENHSVPTVAIQGIALAGRMTAPEGKPAVPELTAMMLSRGTRTADKRTLAARLDDVGAGLDISSGRYDTGIAGSGLSRNLKLILETLADELRNPAFPDSELSKAKLEMRTDVLQAYDNTAQRAYDRVTQIVFPEGHPYRSATKDVMLASIDRSNAADLRAFHKQRYVGSGMYFAIVGDVDPSEVATMFEALFGAIPRGERPEYPEARTTPGAPTREVITMAGKANMDLMCGMASGLRRTDPDYDAAIIANAVLGQSALTARLGKRIRDTEGLSYSLWSRFLMADYLDGLWILDIKLAPQNLSKAMQSAREVIDEYAKDGPTQEEIDAQKSFFAGNFQVRLGTNAGVAQALVDAEKFGFGPSYLDEYPARIRAVTRGQVLAALRAHLSPDALTTVVAGDLTSLPQ
jgi:zinc protease